MLLQPRGSNTAFDRKTMGVFLSLSSHARSQSKTKQKQIILACRPFLGRTPLTAPIGLKPFYVAGSVAVACRKNAYLTIYKPQYWLRGSFAPGIGPVGPDFEQPLEPYPANGDPPSRLFASCGASRSPLKIKALEKSGLNYFRTPGRKSPCIM
jgi:hypothetical protein